MRRLIVLIAAITGGCAGADSPTAPSVTSHVVVNKPGEFRFQSRHLSPTTETFSYVWLTRGTNVDTAQTGRIEGGVAHLTVTDPLGNGLMVRLDTPQLWAIGGLSGFARDAGTWRIEVHLEAVTGTVDYRVTADPLP